MRYLCLVCLVEREVAAMSESEAHACTDESLAYDEVLMKSGHFILAHALERVESAATVRVRNAKVLTTDGPFAGSIEVRPIREIERPMRRIP